MSNIAKNVALLLDEKVSASAVTSIQQRLETICAQLDLVMEALALRERLADQTWSALERDTIGARGAGFIALLQQRDAARQALSAAQGVVQWTAVTEAAFVEVLGPLDDQLYRLAQDLPTYPAKDDIGLHAKALAIIEFAEEQSDDIVHRLAASLAADILKR